MKIEVNFAVASIGDYVISEEELTDIVRTIEKATIHALEEINLGNKHFSWDKDYKDYMDREKPCIPKGKWPCAKFIRFDIQESTL
ncbi:MAG: hypothetical protein KME14_26735 [Tildeniella torsiva UHER 1998/13D]|jgi:hypothetical protein|nr:hypothetical protein [Tildeniella torsiva UHER 1998/13D]